MISLTGGVTGSAKTYSSVVKMMKVLERTKKRIVTNIQELELGKIQAFLDERAAEDKKFGRLSIWNDDVTKRIFIIPRPETGHYYRYRGIKTLEKFEERRGESIQEQDIRLEAYFKQMEDCGQVFFCMDELHRHFKSERWDEIGAAVMFHLAQHRHLDDEFWGISQNPEQIAARFNRQVHEYHYWRNHYKEQFGIFGKPGSFYCRSYYFVPKTGNQNAIPFQEGKLKFDSRIGELYRTRGALGGSSTVAETETNFRFKLPWWSIIVIVAAGLSLVSWGLWEMPKAIGPALGHFVGSSGPGLKKALGGSATPKDLTGPSASNMPQPPRTVEKKPSVTRFISTSKVTGVSNNAGHFTVNVDDGRVFTEQTSEVLAITRSCVILRSGETIYYRLPSDAAPKSPVPAPVDAVPVQAPDGRLRPQVPSGARSAP